MGVRGLHPDQRLVDPSYAERLLAGERISTAFVESTGNQVISKRMVKKQAMRWTQKGAHLLLLQVRTRVLNDDLADDVHRWYPGFSHMGGCPPFVPDSQMGSGALLTSDVPEIVGQRFPDSWDAAPPSDWESRLPVEIPAFSQRVVGLGPPSPATPSGAVDESPPRPATAPHEAGRRRRGCGSTRRGENESLTQPTHPDLGRS